MRPLLAAILLSAIGLAAQSTPTDPTAGRGACVLAGGGKLPPVVFERFLALAGGAGAAIVLVPTASQTADSDTENADTLRLYRERMPGAAITLLHTRDRAVADSEAFCAPLRTATGVWFTGGDQGRLADAYLGTRCEREVMAVLARGGVIGGTSAGTAIQTRVMIAGGRNPPEIATGFDCVPGAISDQHFLKRERLPRLLQALALQPGHFGIGVDEGTAAVVRHGSLLSTIGDSKVVLVLAAAGGFDELAIELPPGTDLDLDGWRLAARQRAQQPMPPHIGPAKIGAGTLVLAGGSDPQRVAATFAEVIPDKTAPVIVLRSSKEPGLGFVKALRECGCSDVRVTDLDPARPIPTDWIAGMATAGGVWITGTDARQILHAFADGGARAALAGVLQRGGAVGGEGWAAASLGEVVTESAIPGRSDTPSLPLRGLALLSGNVIDQPVTEVPVGCRLLRLRPSAVAIVRGGEFDVVAGTIEWSDLESRGEVGNAVELHVLEPGARYDLITGARR